MKASSTWQTGRRAPGFTLVEIMLSTTILVILMLVCTTALDYTRRTWAFSRAKVEQFREARVAFETVSKNLSQATLNTYWDYYYPSTGSNVPPANVATPPGAYVRHSELQFQSGSAVGLMGQFASARRNPGHAVFFQAPLGLSIKNPGLGNLLNARGYYVQFGSDEADRPGFVVEQGAPVNFRYRLMEYRPPAELVSVSGLSAQGNTIYTKPADWFRQDLSTTSRVVADNIVLMVISPKTAEDTNTAGATAPGDTGGSQDPTWIAPRYEYNSLDRNNATIGVDPVVIDGGKAFQGTQHLLPPMVQLTMVAVDEASSKTWMELKLNNQPVDLLTEAKASFVDALKYDSDLEKVKQYLTEQKLNYRVFSSTIALRNARWDGRKN